MIVQQKFPELRCFCSSTVNLVTVMCGRCFVILTCSESLEVYLVYLSEEAVEASVVMNTHLCSTFAYLSHTDLIVFLFVCLTVPLQQSRVGLSVNTLRKKSKGSEVASFGKKLIKQWKKLVPGAVFKRSDD